MLELPSQVNSTLFAKNQIIEQSTFFLSPLLAVYACKSKITTRCPHMEPSAEQKPIMNHKTDASIVTVSCQQRRQRNGTSA